MYVGSDMTYQYLYWMAFGVLLLGLVVDRNVLNHAAKFYVFLPALVFLAFVVAVTVDQFDIDVYRNIYSRLSAPPGEWRVDMFPEYVDFFLKTFLR